jgi:hypothetical protein
MRIIQMEVPPQTKDRRREHRSEVDLPLQVWGVDTQGERFLQNARARDVSLSGALLSGLDAELTSGDVIGILFAGKKARFRVVWIRYDHAGEKMQAAVHRFDADECPWLALLSEEPAATQPGITAPDPKPSGTN